MSLAMSESSRIADHFVARHRHSLNHGCGSPQLANEMLGAAESSLGMYAS
jgi:hypothetical protein